MTVALASPRAARRPNYRRRRALGEAGAIMVGVVLLIWWLLPLYNMVLIALDPNGATEFAGYIWPPAPTLDAFKTVLFQRYWYLEDFWHQLGNSFYIGLATMGLTVAISSLAGFALGRMRLSRGWLISNAALLIYTIPAYFLVIPYYRLMHTYGLMDNLWGIIAANVAFTAPYALLILQWYGRLIPMELDEAARIDGASRYGTFWQSRPPYRALAQRQYISPSVCRRPSGALCGRAGADCALCRNSDGAGRGCYPISACCFGCASKHDGRSCTNAGGCNYLSPEAGLF